MRTWRLFVPIATVGSLATCSGSNESTGPGSGPGPNPGGPPAVATVEVSLPAALLIGDTATAVVVLKDASGNVLTGRTVGFTTSDGNAASVSPAGLVTALAAGGPLTIGASAEGKAGAAAVTVRDDQRFGYVWANQPTTDTYAPNHSYVFNSSGGAVTITRTNGGSYTVRFAGLGREAGQRENVQVNSYTGIYYCNLAGWQVDGPDLVVTIRCFAPPDTPQDAFFTVLVTGARALGGRLGFALANQAGTASYSPANPHNSAHGPVTVTRTGTGTYRTAFGGLARGAAGPEMVMVTQVGSGMDRCVVSSWDFGGLSVDVACTDRTGAPADAQFSLLVLERGRTGQRTGFAWADDQASAQYTPHAAYSFNSAGGTITGRRTAPGEYSVTWDGLIKGVGTETVLVTAYGAASRFCRTGSWGMLSATEFRVYVTCFDPLGVQADARFDVIVVQ